MSRNCSVNVVRITLELFDLCSDAKMETSLFSTQIRPQFPEKMDTYCEIIECLIHRLHRTFDFVLIAFICYRCLVPLSTALLNCAQALEYLF
jgi:hypothetical protein